MICLAIILAIVNVQVSAKTEEIWTATKGQSEVELTKWHNMNVFVDYSNLVGLRQKDEGKWSYLVQVLMPMVRDHVFQTLQVQENVSITPMITKCAGATISEDLLNKKTSADLILIVTADSDTKNQYISWAEHCQSNKYTGRPQIGRLNFNPTFLNTDMELTTNHFNTIMSSLTHILAFSPELFKFYIDWNTGKRYGASNVMASFTHGTNQLNMIVTPRVKAFSQNHFNCSTLQGAPVVTRSDNK